MLRSNVVSNVKRTRRKHHGRGVCPLTGFCPVNWVLPVDWVGAQLTGVAVNWVGGPLTGLSLLTGSEVS